MNTKPIPGPWECDTAAQPIIINTVGDTEPSIVAVVYDRSCYPPHTNPLAQFDEETAAAHARLIAEAPNLAKALSDLCGYIERDLQNNAPAWEPEDLPKYIPEYATARALLAKAGLR